MKYIVLLYRGCCGGFGDRLNGLVSAILLSLATNRELLIRWENTANNINIDDIFNFGTFDYRKNPIPITKTNSRYLDIIDKPGLLRSQLEKHDLNTVFPENVWVLRCNHNIANKIHKNVRYRFNDYENDVSDAYRLAFDILNPKIELETIYTSKPLVGVQLRCGDAYMKVGGHKPVHNVSALLHRLLLFISYKFPDHDVYFSSDHPTAVREFETLCKNNNNATAIKVFHTPQSNLHFERSKPNTMQTKNIIKDIIRLLKTDALIITACSNYGRIAGIVNPTPHLYQIVTPQLFIVPVIKRSDLFVKPQDL